MCGLFRAVMVMVNFRKFGPWIQARMILWLLLTPTPSIAQNHSPWNPPTATVSSNFLHESAGIAKSNKAMMTSMIQSLESMAKVKQNLQNSHPILTAISSVPTWSSTPPPSSYFKIPAAADPTDSPAFYPPPTWQLPAPMPTHPAVWPTFSPSPTQPAQHWAIRHHTRPMVTMTTTMRPMRERRPRNPWTALLGVGSFTLTRLFMIVLRELTRLVQIAAQTFVGLVGISVAAANSLIQAAIWRTLEIFTMLLGMVLVALIDAIALIIVVYLIVQNRPRLPRLPSPFQEVVDLFSIALFNSFPPLEADANLFPRIPQDDINKEKEEFKARFIRRESTKKLAEKWQKWRPNELKYAMASFGVVSH